MLEDVLQKLEGAMRNKVTADILQEAIKSPDGGVYFDDFLGDGDLDIKGNPIVRSLILSKVLNWISFWNNIDKTDRKFV